MTDPTQSPSSITPIQRRVVLAACFGTFLEWYDFLTFASLATYFSVLFFPSDNPVAALLASLATFGVGMLVRPLGAAVFGSLGDKYGRRPIFITTIFLMGMTTFAVGLLPTYAQVGMLAPVLLLVLRLLQGFAVGGEIGGAAVYLTEHAPTNRRGFYTSVLQLMGPLGIMASMLQVVALQYWLSPAEFSEWGWRVPFLLSILLLAISMKSRMSMIESPIYLEMQESNTLSKAPLRECLRDRRTLGRMALLFFCISAGGSLLFFSSQVYTNVYLKSVVKLDARLAGTLVMFSTLALFPLTVFCGWLSDRIGRRPIMLAGLLLGALAIFPVFLGLLHYGNPALAQFNRNVTVQLSGEGCHYNPFVSPRNDCERNQEWLTKQGVIYQLNEADGTPVQVAVQDQLPVAAFQPDELKRTLQAADWPEQADAQQTNRYAIVGLLLVLVLALAMITGPQTAVLAELFPARTRYTAAALPHNLSAGWIGGMSPFMVTLIGTRMGDVSLGITYPVALLSLAFVVGLLFLPETKNVPLEH
ncbi:MAG TPA: MFS transporter [Gallionella sp.]|nr:MFS transporter [Gallionella sp.]